MEVAILIGIQASGKSQFYREHLAGSYRLISLDVLKTRQREARSMEECFARRESFVVDNTNPRKEDRWRYIDAARKHNFKVIGYYFEPDLAESLKRNEQRLGKARVPKVAIFGILKRLQKPSMAEGFDRLFLVRSAPGNSFVIEEAAEKNEIKRAT